MNVCPTLRWHRHSCLCGLQADEESAIKPGLQLRMMVWTRDARVCTDDSHADCKCYAPACIVPCERVTHERRKTHVRDVTAGRKPVDIEPSSVLVRLQQELMDEPFARRLAG
jgi:hypothetical protein